MTLTSIILFSFQFPVYSALNNFFAIKDQIPRQGLNRENKELRKRQYYKDTIVELKVSLDV